MLSGVQNGLLRHVERVSGVGHVVRVMLVVGLPALHVARYARLSAAHGFVHY